LAFIQALLQTGAVVKFWSDCTMPMPTYAAALQRLGIEVRSGDWRSFIAWIKANGAALDHALLSRPDVAESYRPLLRRYSDARITFYGHDLHHDRMHQCAIAQRDATIARAALRMLRRERRIWHAADVVLYPSQAEADRVAALAPKIIPYAVQPYGFADFAAPRHPAHGRTVLFVAGFAHPPNEDAAGWLVQAIMPLVRRHVPSVRLAIVGSQPTARVLALAGPDVMIAPDVSDAELRAWYAVARVAVVPLRYGAGVKRKVTEALREGLPLVTTSIGAQGLPGLDAVASIGDTVELIAAALVVLLGDDTLWSARSAAGIIYARENFSDATLRTSLIRAMGLTPLPRAAEVYQGPDLGLAAEAAHHRESLFQVSNEIGDILQPDMQPHHWAVETGAPRGTGDEAGGRQRQALEAAPGRADAEQRQCLDERVGALG
jgi:glycosyltransferase involved in cell wall biosynthesis